MAEFKIDGRMKVKKLKENFFNEFGGVLRVYNGRSKAEDDALLASIRSNDAAKGGELLCRASRTVGKFEKEMWDVFGIKVQVATKDDFMLVLDGVTLAKLKDIPEKATKEIMENFVAYKRKKKTNDEEAEPEVEEVNDEEQKLTKRLSLSFRLNGGDHFSRIRMIPVTKEFVQNMAEEADDMCCSPSSNGNFIPHLMGREEVDEMFDESTEDNENLPLEFAFIMNGGELYLDVTDDEGDDVYNDDYAVSYSLRNLLNDEEAADEYDMDDPEDEAEYDRYHEYLFAEPTETDDVVGQSIAKSWKKVQNNEISGNDFFTDMMKESLKAVNGEAAALHGENQLTFGDIRFQIEIPEDEEFDPDKLDFIGLDQAYEESGLLFNMLSYDVCLMNVIMYDGKLYFANKYDMELSDNEGDELFDIVNEDMNSAAPDMYNFEYDERLC